MVNFNFIVFLRFLKLVQATSDEECHFIKYHSSECGDASGGVQQVL